MKQLCKSGIYTLEVRRRSRERQLIAANEHLPGLQVWQQNMSIKQRSGETGEKGQEEECE